MSREAHTGSKHASSAPWIGAVVAIVLHAGIATAVLTVDPHRFHAEAPVEIDVQDLPPPEVKPPPPPPPPPPKLEPRRVVAVRPARVPRETPPPEPPPPSPEPPPKVDDPPPLFGAPLSSTVAGPSTVSVPVGGTLNTKPAPHPASAKPSGSGNGDGITPVAAIYIRKYPEKLFMPDSAEIYPADARRMGLEGLVKFKLLIDEKGNVVRVKALNHVGHGFDEAATQALLKAKFTPAIATDGRPVACDWVWNYRFETQ
jgi:protein TonB